MILIKKVILILLCLFLTGCAGMTDYTIDLENGYRIDRLSAHQIAIYGDKPVQSDDETIVNYLYVPAKVTDVWWNKDYIVTKQLVLVVDEKGYEKPPEKLSNKEISYWIIDVNNHQVFGPFDEKELEAETDNLGLTKKISLTSIEKLK
ncbi:DUF3997 domain-containing protein [Lysinibacillus xylanilyticus]|uniref:DUF3997 domain-containing protein n=1 Tax=Lysinibacillus xylanilyticus TaxID=582475 RepID=UPI0038156C2F